MGDDRLAGDRRKGCGIVRLTQLILPIGAELTIEEY